MNNLYESIALYSTREIIEQIIKFKHIDNAWKNTAIQVLAERYDLPLNWKYTAQTHSEVATENLEVLGKTFPEHFL
jgi:hypothetical protein